MGYEAHAIVSTKDEMFVNKPAGNAGNQNKTCALSPPTNPTSVVFFPNPGICYAKLFMDVGGAFSSF